MVSTYIWQESDMLGLIDSDLFSLVIVVSILMDLMRIKNSTETGKDRFFRHVTVIWVAFLSIDILCTLCSSGVISIPAWMLDALRTVRIISYPTMVFLWLHYILSELSLNSKLYRSLLITASYPWAFFIFLAVGDIRLKRFFLFDDGSRLTGGLGLLVMVVLCLVYSLEIIVIVCSHFTNVPRDKGYTMLSFPLMFSAAVLVLYFTGSHLLFSISQSMTVFISYIIMQNRRLTYDTLTGVPNRKNFLIHLERAFYRNRRCSIVVADIEDFKFFNHRFGQSNGDELLVSLARYFEKVAPGNCIYRIAGDQFAMILKRFDEDAACRMIQDIQQRFTHSWSVGEAQYAIKLRYGVVVFPDQVETPDDALAAIAFTLSEAKLHETNRIAVFNKKTMEKREYLLGIKEMLRSAIEQDSLMVVYQPIYDMQTMRIVSAEALVRLHDPSLGMIYPSDFIPIAEETGLIIDMTDQVISRVCGVWRKIGGHNGALSQISVNLSAVNVLQPQVETRLFQLIEDGGVDATRIGFELTESILIESFEKIEHVFTSLMQHGVYFTLDDYGKGYSNMELLFKIPFQTVKLDKSIIACCETQRTFLESIVLMLHKMGKIIVAEGVETEKQFAIMREIGMDRVQGYYVARPMTENEFLEIFHHV